MKIEKDIIEIENALGTVRIYGVEGDLIIENLAKVKLSNLQIGNYLAYLTGQEIYQRFPHLIPTSSKMGEKVIRENVVYMTVILEENPQKVEDPAAHYYFFDNRVEALNFITTLGDIWIFFKNKKVIKNGK